MSESLNKCCRRFKEEICAVECCMANVGSHLTSATEKGVDAIDADLHKAIAKCEELEDKSLHATKRIGHFLEELKCNAVTDLENWITDRTIDKIEKDADKKEDRAVDALIVVAYSLHKAEVAIIDALRARKMALEVAG